jgi:hypothetical protein
LPSSVDLAGSALEGVGAGRAHAKVCRTGMWRRMAKWVRFCIYALLIV